jgi:hypothetical protein
MELCQPGQMPPTILHVHIVASWSIELHLHSFISPVISLRPVQLKARVQFLFHWSRLKMDTQIPTT